MTVKLYENDAYIKEFEATVLSCEKADNGYYVVLDKTAFFPEGGGQQADEGRLNDAQVLDVQTEGGVITHLVDKELSVNSTVTGTLDWDTRFCRMQNHTGEHLVSGIIHSMFGYDNLGFHMSDKTLTLDPSGILTDEDIKAVELKANKAIYENKEIFVSYPTAEEISSLDYRSKLELTENLRLVTIDGYDVCACCAPHVHRTGEIGVIKIIDYIQYKGGMRLTMVCGLNAFCDYSTLHDDNKELMHTLSAPRDKVLEFVLRDHEVIGTQKATINKLNSQLALSQLDMVTVGDTTVGFTKGASFDDLRAIVNENITKAEKIALFSQGENDDYSYVVASDSTDIRDTVRKLNESFCGKGGGRPNYAQGKITAKKDDILSFFEN